MLPSPSTALPSETTATVFFLIVRFQAASRSFAIREQTRDAGRVRHREVVAGLHRHVRVHVDLAAEVHQERPVGGVLDRDAVHRLHRLHDRVGVLRVRRLEGDVADLRAAVDADEVDRVEQAAGVADRGGEVGEGPGAVLEADADGDAEGSGVVAHDLIVLRQDGRG
jgi:hypothetical protein